MFPASHSLTSIRSALTCLALATGCFLCASPADAAPSSGNVKVLGIRVAFASHNNAPSLETIGNRLQGAKVSFERYSYGVLTIRYDTVAVTLPQDRGNYTASSLANAAETRAANKGFNPNGYDIVGFFHGGHPAGNKAIVGGKRFWTTTGGATIHEMGHTFGWGHQSRWASNNSNPIGPGEPVTPDMWHFMANSAIDADPYDKWTRNWITNRYNIVNDGSFTRRLYTCDQKDTDPANDRRVLRVTRSTSTSAAYWIGYRSRLMNNQNDGATGKNNLLRQGLVFYWDRGTNGGQNVLLIDMHPAGGGWDNHSLQPGETYADTGGDVYITNLGRGGSPPNEYIDVRINRGEFPGNQAPVPSWDAPATWEAGVPLTITVTPHDPDGDAVACMWTTADREIPYNTSANTLTKTWNLAGSYRVKVVVSDMKGQVATLARTITVTGDYPVSFADAGFGPWSETVPGTTWTAEVLVNGNAAATATINVANYSGDFAAAETGISRIINGGKSLVRVALEDPVNGAGDEPASGARVRLDITDVQPGYALDGISLTSSGGVFAPEALTNIQFDGAGTTVVDASGSTNILIGGVGNTPEPVSPGGTVNFAEPGSWDNANGFTSGAHSLAWSVDAAGSTFLSIDYQSESAPAISRENLAFGVGITEMTGPHPPTYDDWVQVISGLSGPEAEFHADANGDTVPNGLAFVLGASDAHTDARELLPTWSVLPGEVVIAFRRSDDANVTVTSAVEYATDLEAWTIAAGGTDGVSITVDDDFYEPGIDRVEVRLPDSLATAGSLFVRLRVGQNTIPP